MSATHINTNAHTFPTEPSSGSVLVSEELQKAMAGLRAENARRARLEAAAPDLLEALKECCSYIATPFSMLEREAGAKRRTALLRRALAAIQKAEGR